MTFVYSFILSLVIVGLLSLIFKAEAIFWLGRLFKKKPKEKELTEEKNDSRPKPIEKFCGFREWSELGGEICTIFQLEDGSEYKVTENICRQCLVWDRYQAWLDSGKKENLSVTLAHTFKGSQPMVIEADNLNPAAERGLSFQDFIIKRRKVPWAGKAAIAFFTLVTYLIVYFSGIFSNPVVYAMPDSFYFTDSNTYAASNCWNMLTTPPASAANDTTQCHSQTGGTDDYQKYCALLPGSHNDYFEASYTGPKNYSWMTANNATLTGDFPAGNWIVNVRYDYTHSGDCSSTKLYLQYKIWKAAANLSSRTTIVDWTDVCGANLSAGTHDCSKSTNPGAVSLDNQVLQIEFRVYETFGYCVVGPNELVKFYVDEGDGDLPLEQLDTPTYAPVPENSIYFAIAVPFIPLIIKKFRLRDYFKK